MLMQHCSYVASKSLSYQYITNRGRIWDVLRNITTLRGRTDNNFMQRHSCQLVSHEITKNYQYITYLLCRVLAGNMLLIHKYNAQLTEINQAR